jgi:hypothetical protein
MVGALLYDLLQLWEQDATLGGFEDGYERALLFRHDYFERE